MLTLSFRFLAGRYHATAWDSHVNEGVVEWPPCPWRLLRALLATAHLKASDELRGSRLCSLINRLAAASPPSFTTPTATVAHTRHYMPDRDDGSTHVFDTFVAPGRGYLDDSNCTDNCLLVHWSVTLDPAEHELLANLLQRLAYLGRAESLVEARLLVTAPGTPEPTPSVRPLLPGESIPVGASQVRLLGPVTPEEYVAWARQIAPPPEAAHEKSPKAIGRGSPPPPSLFEALQVDTNLWRKAGWALPPGSRWIDYVRLAPAPRSIVQPRRRPTSKKQFDTARFALTAPVLPSLRALLPLTERFHDALVKHSDNSRVFSGIDTDGSLRTGHRHAFLFPECDPVHGFMTHVTVYATDGFGDRERHALESIRRLYGRESSVGIGLTLLALGRREDFINLPFFRSARCWTSLTPFVATRHAKTFRSGQPKLDPATGLAIGSPEHDLHRLLRGAGLPAPTCFRITASPPLTGRRLPWLDFVHRRRNGKGRHGHASPTGFEITFPIEVTGPLALGYAAHFGLGLFVPVRTSTPR